MKVVVGQASKNGEVGFTVVCGKRTIFISVVDYTNEKKEDKAYEGRVAVLEAFVGQEVLLFKRRGSYIDRESGDRKYFTNYFLQCGDDWIAIEVKYQPVGEKKEDPNYGLNRRVLSAFAEALPPKFDTNNGTTEGETAPAEEAENAPSAPTLIPMDDKVDIPF